MVYLKSIVFGIGAAIAASVLWILAIFVLPILMPFLLSRVTGAGGIGAASISSGSILAVALMGFAGGFSWKLHRASRVVRQ